MKIGIVRETKIPVDRRVAITPEIAEQICTDDPLIQFFIQPCNMRAFSDKEYQNAGVVVCEDLSHCDFLIGVKEVALDVLLEHKNYLFFAHVGKKQPSNRKLIQRLSALGCSLYDYEYFVDKDGKRLIAFGYWAGVVGAYNALVGLFKKEKGVKLPLPQSFVSKEELFQFVGSLQLSSWKFAITGTGRVGQGVFDLLRQANFFQVDTDSFLTKNFDHAVFCVLNDSDYVEHSKGMPFETQHFHENPSEYRSRFLPYTESADVLIVGHFWHPKAPRLFSLKDTRQSNFSIKLIADITCDIEGCNPLTLRSSTHERPFYDYNPDLDGESAPFSSDRHVTIMAVDNLPNALPREASNFFSSSFNKKLFPALKTSSNNELWESAKILHKGKLTPKFSYLNDYLGARVEE